VLGKHRRYMKYGLAVHVLDEADAAAAKGRLEKGRWKSALTIARALTPEIARLGLRNDLLSMWASLQDALAAQQVEGVMVARDFFRRRWKLPARVKAS